MDTKNELQAGIAKGFIIAEEGGIWAAQFPDRWHTAQDNYQRACKKMELAWEEHTIFISHLPDPLREGQVRTAILVSPEFMARLRAREATRKIPPDMGTWERLQDAGFGWQK